MRILIDMDDVMVDLLDAWIDFLNKKYNSNLTKDDITDWNLNICILPKLLENNLLDDIDLYEPLFIPEFWNTVKPIPGAVDCVKKLNNMYTLYVVTASHYNSFGPKVENCLLKHFPFLNHKQVVCLSNKEIIRADYLIDDNYNNIEKFVSSNFSTNQRKGYGLLMNAPYNVKELSNSNLPKSIKDNIIRVHNWDNILNVIKERK